MSSSLALAAVWCPEYSLSPSHSLAPSASEQEEDNSIVVMERTPTPPPAYSDIVSTQTTSPSSPTSSSPSLALSLPLPLSPAAIQHALRELFVVASFGSYQVTTLVSGIAALLRLTNSHPSSASPTTTTTTTTTSRGWQNALMHLALHILRQNIAFQGVTIPRLRFWSNAAGASSLPRGVSLHSTVRFTVNRHELLTFERLGCCSEYHDAKHRRYPTVPAETQKDWSLPSNATYELHAEWLIPDTPPAAAGHQQPRDLKSVAKKGPSPSAAAGQQPPAAAPAAAEPSPPAAGESSPRPPTPTPPTPTPHAPTPTFWSWFGGSTTTPPPTLRRKVIYYLHGGAYIAGSPQIYRNLTGRISKHTRTRLFALRYRLAPESPFPAALHDAFAGYLYLTNPYHPAFSHLDPPAHEPISPQDIVLMGDSAGGGLALCLLNYLNLYLRDAATGKLLVPFPAAAVLLSPWADLTFTSHSWHSNDRLDWLPAIARDIHHEVAPGVPHPVYMYLYGEKASRPKAHLAALTRASDGTDEEEEDNTAIVHDRVEQFVRHPLVSPIFASSLAGLPPLLIQAGDAEVLRDDSLALAYKYDADNVGRDGSTSWVRHEMFPDMVHVFVAAPWLKASAAALNRIDRFLDEVELGEPMPPADNAQHDGVLVDSHVGL
ncbi:hypothetical protein HDU87_006263 [Geranomyces variabilis]|uniref:Alpha/beta hydrolase fold-3 domain-containing protein n=1 Tax=Geranomyces variabilis TaxID=109894 RepID=A0AAD5TFK5_9FUNG|nr:hypothetical protein HDU87_006263 [Geranomyces variabilis]